MTLSNRIYAYALLVEKIFSPRVPYTDELTILGREKKGRRRNEKKGGREMEMGK